VHVLDGRSDFRRWQSHTATPLHATDRDGWTLAAGDHDRDGVPDVYAVARAGGSGRTEVHVLDGASGWTRWSAHAATALHAVDTSWDLIVADADGDGYHQVVAVARGGRSGRTEVHVLEDRTYDRFVLHAATALHPTVGVPTWVFRVD
jgi:hypothetical protein